MYRLDEASRTLLEQLRQIAAEQIAPHAAEVDSDGRFPREAVDALAKSGFLGLTIPADSGGMGQGMAAACAMLDVVAQQCASTAMVYLMHLCGCACYTLSPESAATVLPRIARGEHLTTLAWSEKGSRSHFWAPVSQAEDRDGHVVLNATKSWVTSANEADSYVVSTRTPGAMELLDTMLYLVHKNDPGIAVSGGWNSLGMRGNDSAPMVLDQCEIPAGRALCGHGAGFARMMEILPWFNLGNAAVSIGIAEAATQSAIRHVTGSRLEHLNSSLADLPNLRARLAQMRIETDRARAHLAAALHAIENPSDTTMLMVLESKAAASETAILVTDLGMRTCGGAAFSRQLSIERNFRDARAMSVMAPTTDVLQEFIGRSLCNMPLF